MRKCLPEETQANIGIPILRWIKSKKELDTLGQLIELRIALETLYLRNIGDGRSELSYRMAIRGSFHLGNNREERKRIFDALRNSYSMASSVIHAGKIKETEKMRKIIEDGQDACRRGILKMLKEGGEPDWDKIMFDPN